MTTLLLGSAWRVAAQTPPPPPPPAPTRPADQPRDAPYRPPIGRAWLGGTVTTDAATPAPVKNAVVALRGDGLRSGWTVITGEDGRFAFDRLPAGRYSIVVTKAGFPTVQYGASRPGRPGTTLLLKEADRVEGLTVRLPKGAVIAGRVVDELGAPVQGFRLQIGQRVVRNGLPTMTYAQFRSTDDRGEFRAFGLAAGDWVLGGEVLMTDNAALSVYSSAEIDAAESTPTGRDATPPSVPTPRTMRSAYYADASSVVDATPIHLEAGEERTGIDLIVRLVPAVDVSGMLTNVDGSVPNNVVLNLVSVGTGRLSNHFGRPDAKGAFAFTGVAPGKYVITARGQSAAGATWLKQEVGVAGVPIADLHLTMQAGLRVSGTWAFAEPGDHPSTAKLQLSPIVSGDDVALGVIGGGVTAADGTFSFDGVPQGHFRLTAADLTFGGERWTLQSVQSHGQDVTDTGLEIGGADVPDIAVTFTRVVTQISGSLQDAGGRPAPDYYVIVFGADPRNWYQGSRWIKAVRPSIDGKFEFTGLPPGSYRLGAVIDVESGDWYEPTFLQQLLPASASITLDVGQKITFPLKLGGG